MTDSGNSQQPLGIGKVFDQVGNALVIGQYRQSTAHVTLQLQASWDAFYVYQASQTYA